MDEHLGTDILLKDGDVLPLPTGDVALVGGRECLAQGLRLLLSVPLGGHWAHPELGSRAADFLQDEDTELGRMELERELAGAAELDPRVTPGSARAEVLEWSHEALIVRVTVQPLGGGNPLSLVIGYGA